MLRRTVAGMSCPPSAQTAEVPKPHHRPFVLVITTTWKFVETSPPGHGAAQGPILSEGDEWRR